MINKKCILMFSGGLDSRLALKIMQEQKFEIIALYFNLPFGEGCCSKECSFNFAQMQGVKLEIFDCTKGRLLKKYLNVLRNPQYGRGKGINPCTDCRIFMLKEAKKYADKHKIELIVTGEVVGERPMSQMKKSMNLIEKETKIKGRLLRPLSARLLPETKYEKIGLVDREKLYGIQGRRRVEQMNLAKKFKINYPSPAGGCLLCEKSLKLRFKNILNRKINDNEITLFGIGRHYIINNCWVVIGRDEQENKIIEKMDKRKYKIIVPKFLGPTAIILDKCKDDILNKVNKLIKAYSKQGSLEDRNKFEKYKL